MFCKKCAHELSDNARFCGKCGNQLEFTQSNVILPASILVRLSNFLIDQVVIVLILVAFLMFSDLFSDLGAAVVSTVGVILYLGYHLICESIWQRTLGKLVTKTKVVDLKGNKPGFAKILGRSFARYIPFERFSFLFSAYPVGWHDSLSRTLVVPAALTPEEVQKINLLEIKKHKSTNIAVIVIVVVLMVVPIIGIMSSVVLASLNTARQKGADAAIKSTLSSFKMSAELYSDSNKGSYSGLCSDTNVLNLLKSVPKNSGVTEDVADYVCNDSVKTYAAEIPLRLGGYWCVDSTGQSLQTENPLGAQTSCSLVVSEDNTKNNNWSTYVSKIDGFSVLLPKTPNVTTKQGLSVGDDSNMTYDVHQYESSDNLNSYVIFKYIYSDSLDFSKEDDVLAVYLDSLVDTENTLISSNYTYQGSNRALEFTLKAGGEMVRGRFILVGQNPYLVLMNYFPANADPKSYDKFINSFKIK